MKFVTFLLISVFFISCKNVRKDIKSVKIKYENENSSSQIAVRCDEFEDSFDSLFKEKDITDRTILKDFDDYLTGAIANSGVSIIDVRTKVIVTYSDSTVRTICFDRFNHALVDGNAVIIDEGFFKLIRDIEKR